jgi:hypothetical protein
MIENPEEILERLRRKWIFLSLISLAILSLAIGIVTGEILHRVFKFSYSWIGPLFLFALGVLLFVSSSWRISKKDITSYLDANYSSMEESAGLLLSQGIPPGSLQEMQRTKTGLALQYEYQNVQFPPNIKRTAIFFTKAFFICLAAEGVFYFFFNPVQYIHYPETQAQVLNPAHNTIAALSELQVRLSPPAYTRRIIRQQDKADILSEEGSTIDWRLKSNKPLSSLGFIFNDSEKIFLQPENGDHTKWTYQRTLKSSGFYQLIIDSQVSEQYKLEMIRDLYPEIDVESPKSKTVLEYGMSEQIPLRLSIRDDYGVRSAGIVATISRGNGEAVKFIEKQIPFSESFQAMDTLYFLHKIIDLQKMGLIPGDELYFYIQATDNHGQNKKSGIFIVSLADTADLMSVGLSMNGPSVKPDYFRSERQIILETQQLLADRHSMSTEAFKNKANDLGVDQKMLRLRYGKFLGEEEESGEPGAENQNAVGNPSNFGNAALVLDAYTDKHDNAEDASFFEKETKDQLKTTLTQMWNAELQLRTFNPESALPYEYKALRLLKDLQQRSRVYVAKTGFKTSSLDLGKRLTGDQDKIQNPVEVENVQDDPVTFAPLRSALGVLQTIKWNSRRDVDAIAILQNAGTALREKAVEDPSKYLPAYVAFQKILHVLENGSPVDDNDIALVENALQRLIKPLSEVPSARENTGKEELSDYYFRNLKKSL